MPARRSSFQASGQAAARDPLALLLELDQADRRVRLPLVRPGAETLLGDRGVLMLAENLLERLRPGDEPRARATELVGRELRCVARALDPDPRRVQLVVGRAAPEGRDRLACPPPLGSQERGERRRLGRRRRRLRLGDVVEPVEEGEVAIAGERLDHRAAGGGPLRVELREERRRFDSVVAEGGDVGREPAREHVEVARRPERAAEPAELGPQRLGPRRLEQRLPGAQKRAEPPGRDAKLVEVLRIRPEARPRVVEQEQPDLRGQRDAERLERRGTAGDGRRRGR